ncbi:hypothetical protein HN510_04355 [Candidatus Woesearchaeota archaeon]|jgi:hypothetical protein|nr:hypothetical protein [Candidatus Woesearchaeota archaeon]
MIIFIKIDLNQLLLQEKEYEWERPYCNKCNCSFYGHGYVFRFFSYLSSGVYLKRWRCPICRSVATIRPDSHWKGFQESISQIFKTLTFRVKYFKWPPWCTRQRGGHWLNKLIANARLNLLLKGNILETISFYQSKSLAIS